MSRCPSIRIRSLKWVKTVAMGLVLASPIVAKATTLAAILSSGTLYLASDTQISQFSDGSSVGNQEKIMVKGKGVVAFGGVTNAPGRFSVSSIVADVCAAKDSPKERADLFAPKIAQEMAQLVADLGEDVAGHNALSSIVWFCGMEGNAAVLYSVETRLETHEGRHVISSQTIRHPDSEPGAVWDVISTLPRGESRKLFKPSPDPCHQVAAMVRAGIEDPTTHSGGEVKVCILDGNGSRFVREVAP